MIVLLCNIASDYSLPKSLVCKQLLTFTFVLSHSRTHWSQDLAKITKAVEQKLVESNAGVCDG